MSHVFKNCLYLFAAKQKVTPAYSYQPGKRGFSCQVNVPGITFTGYGVARNKKEAQGEAARNFCEQLVEFKIISPSELPELNDGEGTSQGPSFHGGGGHTAIASTSHGGTAGAGVVASKREHLQRESLKRRLEGDQESSGNWTLENARSRLILFMDKTHQQMDIAYNSLGPAHNLSYSAEMSVYVPSLNTTIHAQEQASNKKLAANALALNLVLQLHKLGVLETAPAPGAKKPSANEIEAKEVVIPIGIQQSMSRLLADMNITPVPQPPEGAQPEPVSMLIPPPVLSSSSAASGSASEVIRGGPLIWLPPDFDWNPWTQRPPSMLNPSLTSSQVSYNLLDELTRKRSDDHAYQTLLQQRKQLPISPMSDEVVAAVRAHSVVIVKGNTGCGKTTQVPQFILDDMIDHGEGATCNIVVTQPRRISAISVAERVSQERNESLGASVGYSVRFDSCLPRHYGSILFCTVGVLLRKMESGLVGVSHVIVDEIHERDLNTDFLLIVLRDMLKEYRDLRVVLMSATIDTNLFVQYFSNCPVIEVGGRLHTVQEYFLEDTIEMLKFVPPPRALEKKKKKSLDDNEDNLNMVCDTSVFSRTTQHAMTQLSEDEISFELIEAILHYVRTYNVPGAVLIFLPGWNVIFSLHRHLQSNPVFGSRDYLLLPCHSQLPRDEQRRVFLPSPPGVTKVVISTNIAESSITIDDVVFVIDACRTKIKEFASETNITHFNTIWASHSSLEQRKGRAGRVRPGYCFHLCSRARYQHLPEHITPEILRTPLHELVLSVLLLKLGHPQSFLSKALEVPPATSINEAFTVLKELQAINGDDQLTSLGTILAKLPVEPRLGRMMIMGCIFNVGDAMCGIAASCGYNEPFLLSPGQKRLTPLHKRFIGRYHSDHLAMLTVLQEWEHAKLQGSDAERSYCSSNSINTSSLRMTAEAMHQLKEILLSVGFPEEVLIPHPVNLSRVNESADMIVALLCAGLHPNVCVHKEKRLVITSDKRIALIHKSSVNLIYKNPSFNSPYLVFEEKIRSKALSARSTTMVEPLQIMLFGSSSIHSCPTNLVRIDDWLPFTMSHQDIALVCGLRHALDQLLHKIADNPFHLSSLTSEEQAVISTVSTLVSQRAGAENPGPSRPRGGYRGRGYYRQSRGYHHSSMPYRRGGYYRTGYYGGGGYDHTGFRGGSGYRGGYYHTGFRGGSGYDHTGYRGGGGYDHTGYYRGGVYARRY